MKDAIKVYKECKQMLENLGIQTGNIQDVKVNTRAQRRWGRCTRKLTFDGYVFTIEISSRLLEDNISDEATNTTMLHELIHTCNNCMNHGIEWKRIANKVNRVYGYNIKRTTSDEEKGIDTLADIKKIAKHKFVCVGCGIETYRHRESNFTKHPERYKCAVCGSDIKREY